MGGVLVALDIYEPWGVLQPLGLPRLRRKGRMVLRGSVSVHIMQNYITWYWLIHSCIQQRLLCAINCQHDCFKEDCQMTGREEVIRDRQATGSFRIRLQHVNPFEYLLLNVNTLRSYWHLDPLRPPLPTPMPMPAFADEIAPSVISALGRKAKKPVSDRPVTKSSKPKPKGGNGMPDTNIPTAPKATSGTFPTVTVCSNALG